MYLIIYFRLLSFMVYINFYQLPRTKKLGTGKGLFFYFLSWLFKSVIFKKLLTRIGATYMERYLEVQIRGPKI